MDALFSGLTLTDVRRDVIRNIVSIGASQDLFDALSRSPDEWAGAQQVEDPVRPTPYRLQPGLAGAKPRRPPPSRERIDPVPTPPRPAVP